MDSRFNGLSDSVSIIEYEDGVCYLNFSNGFQVMENHVDSQFSFPSLDPSSLHPSPKIGSEMDSPDDFHSNHVLKYLNQILLEENMEERPSMFHDSIALRATEKSLYDALGEEYPSSAYQLDHDANSPDSSLFQNSCNGNGSYVDPSSMVDPGVYKVLPGRSFGYSSDGQVDVPAYSNLIPNVYNDNESMLQFQKGMEEASKFLVTSNQSLIDLDKYQLPAKSVEDFQSPSVKLENEVKDECLQGSRGRKHLHWEEESVLDEKQKCSKQSAIHEEEEIEISELLDQIFLCNGPKIVLNCSNADNVLPDQQNGVTNGASNGRSCTRRKANKSEDIDLSTLLVICAQSVAANDRRTANELLKKIRQNSSTSGNACQRLAHVFANGLEARLSGTGTQLYAPGLSVCLSAEMLKAYQVYLSAFPFRLIPVFFAKNMIADLASKAEAIHIVDFGIRYGFQWPVLIQHLSTLPGGPPRLRITGIEYPQPGFRPAERVLETGQRLANYCDRFHVPFEYQAIATQKWEEIKVKDLNLKKSEVLVVSSNFRLQNLPDEADVTDSPRDAVLKLIRAMNPNLFVNSVINGLYSSPFFVTRFREALYHYSSLFDMLDSTIPCEDDEQRMKFEQEFFGDEVFNVVSCEGMDRVERPETYKQWHTRHLRAGLKPLPLEQEFMHKLRGTVRKGCHKDFVFDEDGCWMLQGWKGRIIYASSCWIPA